MQPQWISKDPCITKVKGKLIKLSHLWRGASKHSLDTLDILYIVSNELMDFLAAKKAADSSQSQQRDSHFSFIYLFKFKLIKKKQTNLVDILLFTNICQRGKNIHSVKMYKSLDEIFHSVSIIIFSIDTLQLMFGQNSDSGEYFILHTILKTDTFKKTIFKYIAEVNQN